MLKKLLVPFAATTILTGSVWIAMNPSVYGRRAGTLSPTEMIKQLGTERISSFRGEKYTRKIPNITVTDQNGKTVRFYDDVIKDRCYCVVFFYTNCTGSCPGTTTKMKAVRERLRNDFGSDMRFVSVSLEPKVDRPEELREYMGRYRIHNDGMLPNWVFLTGMEQDVDDLRRAFGLYDRDPVIDSDKTQHAAVMIFGNDRTNRICSLPSGSDTEDLVKTITRFAGETDLQRYGKSIEKRDVTGHSCNKELTGDGQCCTNRAM
jgi:protein SCO1/2